MIGQLQLKSTLGAHFRVPLPTPLPRHCANYQGDTLFINILVSSAKLRKCPWVIHSSPIHTVCAYCSIAPRSTHQYRREFDPATLIAHGPPPTHAQCSTCFARPLPARLKATLTSNSLISITNTLVTKTQSRTYHIVYNRPGLFVHLDELFVAPGLALHPG